MMNSLGSEENTLQKNHNLSKLFIIFLVLIVIIFGLYHFSRNYFQNIQTSEITSKKNHIVYNDLNINLNSIKGNVFNTETPYNSNEKFRHIKSIQFGYEIFVPLKFNEYTFGDGNGIDGVDQAPLAQNDSSYLIERFYKDDKETFEQAVTRLLANRAKPNQYETYTSENSDDIRDLKAYFPDYYEVMQIWRDTKYPEAKSRYENEFVFESEYTQNYGSYYIYDSSYPNRFYLFRGIDPEIKYAENLPWFATFRIIDGIGEFEYMQTSTGLPENYDPDAHEYVLPFEIEFMIDDEPFKISNNINPKNGRNFAELKVMNTRLENVEYKKFSYETYEIVKKLQELFYTPEVASYVNKKLENVDSRGRKYLAPRSLSVFWAKKDGSGIAFFEGCGAGNFCVRFFELDTDSSISSYSTNFSIQYPTRPFDILAFNDLTNKFTFEAAYQNGGGFPPESLLCKVVFAVANESVDLISSNTNCDLNEEVYRIPKIVTL